MQVLGIDDSYWDCSDGTNRLIAATLTKHERFVYNGFKLVEVRDALNANALTKSFTWQEGAGLDTPLSMKYNGQTGYYQLDGNKNVLKVTAQDGTVLANYTYGPFGQVLTSSGTWKDLNPWQFSSEYFDAELGLVYYNYRHYSPTLGRWTTRDPIEENDGVNLYAMARNNAIIFIDNNGLWWTNIHQQATARWARMQNYRHIAAEMIGNADEAVDSLQKGIGPLPYVGDQSYHFNTNDNGVGDSRLQHYDEHFDNAIAECSKGFSVMPGYTSVRPDFAAEELGTALHPLQDWVAHGDYGIHFSKPMTSIHNARSKQEDFGAPEDYPDLFYLDVVGSSDGSAAGKYLQVFWERRSGVGAGSYYSTEYDYAIYEKGNKRYKLTKEKTDKAFKEFADFLKGLEENHPCKCFFLN